MKKLTLTSHGKYGYLIEPNAVWFPEGICENQIRGEFVAHGPFDCEPYRYKALAITGDTWDGEPLTVFGVRILQNARSRGYELEGSVSIGGKRYRGFTTKVTFDLPEGAWVDVAAIHVCLNQPKSRK